MKFNFKNIAIIALLFSIVACDDYLDMEPLDKVTPEKFLLSENDLATYTIAGYDFDTHDGYGLGTFAYDNNTDNQATSKASDIWTPDQYRVKQSGGAWDFEKIRNINYFLDKVIPRWKANKLSGNKENIKHYIGEAYFLRAYEYFNKVKSLGDFPIIKKPLNDVKDLLVKESQRRPQNAVVRFILSDLDSAVMMMSNTNAFGKNRLTKNAALLFKSRVALNEGTWLTYHKGTCRVPGGDQWPGAKMDYLKDFKIDINSEINYFLDQAMESAKIIADNIHLAVNNGNTGDTKVFNNPYYKMFASDNLSAFDEVLLWREYNSEISVGHHVVRYYTTGANTGYTRSYVESFLMKSGLPIYADKSYAGDDYIKDTKKDRDDRLQLFMKAPEEPLATIPVILLEGYPNIIDIGEQRYVTGYAIKKGLPGGDAKSFEPTILSTTGSIVFRATEAYLNYIEADYVKNASLDSNSKKYWKEIRDRAGVNNDFDATIAATDLSKENDWAKYSANKLVDKTLYNIRRERRCEFIAEGFRMDDLKRWKALDQVSNYQIEGIKLWGPMEKWFVNDSGKTTLKTEPTSDNPNVSPKANSLYLRPYQIKKKNNEFYKGYNWNKAYYLAPISFENFVLTTKDGNIDSSSIYQNPSWPKQAGQSAIDK